MELMVQIVVWCLAGVAGVVNAIEYSFKVEQVTTVCDAGGGALVPNAENGFVSLPQVQDPMFMQPIEEAAAANNFTPKGLYALCGRYNVDGREMNLVQFTAQPFSYYVKDVGINREGKQCYTLYFPNVPSHAVQ